MYVGVCVRALVGCVSVLVKRVVRIDLGVSVYARLSQQANLYSRSHLMHVVGELQAKLLAKYFHLLV
jgi:hypothetical protein